MHSLQLRGLHLSNQLQTLAMSGCGCQGFWAARSASQGLRRFEDAAQAAYIGGLGVAFAVNALTHTGQPALLYLVPATLGAILLMAAVRGEVGVPHVSLRNLMHWALYGKSP